jgi:hypothetical protein
VALAAPHPLFSSGIPCIAEDSRRDTSGHREPRWDPICSHLVPTFVPTEARIGPARALTRAVCGAPPRPRSRYRQIGLTEQDAYAAALKLLDRPDRPDAIYATFDRLAIGVILAARSLGLSVPADLLVAGCTDSDAAKLSRPSLTVLDLNPAEVGRQAVELLIDIIEGREPA